MHHAANLALMQPHGTQHTQLASALAQRQQQGVGNTHQSDEHRQRQQGVHDVEHLVHLRAQRATVFLLGFHLNHEERRHRILDDAAGAPQISQRGVRKINVGRFSRVGLGVGQNPARRSRIDHNVAKEVGFRINPHHRHHNAATRLAVHGAERDVVTNLQASFFRIGRRDHRAGAALEVRGTLLDAHVDEGRQIGGHHSGGGVIPVIDLQRRIHQSASPGDLREPIHVSDRLTGNGKGTRAARKPTGTQRIQNQRRLDRRVNNTGDASPSGCTQSAHARYQRHTECQSQRRRRRAPGVSGIVVGR